jgi:hypothetical protein
MFTSQVLLPPNLQTFEFLNKWLKSIMLILNPAMVSIRLLSVTWYYVEQYIIASKHKLLSMISRWNFWAIYMLTKLLRPNSLSDFPVVSKNFSGHIRYSCQDIWAKLRVDWT